MESLTEYVFESFLTHWPSLRQNPQELAARLQRRHQVWLQRPPRAWCVAIRANDLRMTPRNTGMDDPYAVAARRTHRVNLNAMLVRRLVAPVEIHWMGLTSVEVAALLGVRPAHLRHARAAGVFTERAVKGLAGSRGRPVPILSRRTLLDPTGTRFLPPAGYWGKSWQLRGDYFPDAHEQLIERHPSFDPYTGRFRRWHWTCPACARPALVMYFPLKVPHIESYLGLNPAAFTDHTSDGPPVDQDALHDPDRAHADDDESDPASTALPPDAYHLDPLSPDAPPAPVPTFACEACHRIAHIDQTTKQGWNSFVTFLSCGLLYGRDIPMPADWKRRKIAYRRRTPNVAPRRNEVLRLLVTTDLTAPEIGKHLGITPGTVTVHTQKLYLHHGVHRRAELREHPAVRQAFATTTRQIA